MEVNTNGSTSDMSIDENILKKVQNLLEQLKISKVYFVDDTANQNIDQETFSGLVAKIIREEKKDTLQSLQEFQNIDFSVPEDILLDEIKDKWVELKQEKQKKLLSKTFKIAGVSDAIIDLEVSNNLKRFFKGEQVEVLTPSDWDNKRDEIVSGIREGEKIILLFDQDLTLAGGRYENKRVQGEDLILEVKKLKANNKLILALLTHTVTEYHEELPKRTLICTQKNELKVADFFVLAKKRLSKPELFADGLKKICLNSYCEKIKTSTIKILKKAQKTTINRLNQFDTYDFDHTVLKSSFTEGVWEPETLVRITDIIFRDAIRQLMIERNYIGSVNPSICSARDISKIDFSFDNPPAPYTEKYKLRHQEMYENRDLVNKLYKPIDNGDIFEITDGAKKGKYILVAQECDLMVRSSGIRGSKIANLLKIDTLSLENLNKEVSKKYQKDIEKKKFLSHFYADKFKLEYFENGTNKVGLIRFSDVITINLCVLDLVVFNNAGEARINLKKPDYKKNNFNHSWQARFNLIKDHFSKEAEILDNLYTTIDTIQDEQAKQSIQAKINYLFSFIDKAGTQVNYNKSIFNFGVKRIARLRYPKSKNLLDRYYLHLSRTAELHDFAG